VASTPPPDAYTPENLLAVATPPGVLVAPGATYAFVVLRALGDANGNLLGVPATFAQLRAELVPDGLGGQIAADMFAPLWPALREAGVNLSDVAAATVFSTSDVVAELEELSDSLRLRHRIAIENLRIDREGGAEHERFCEIRGRADLPLFQRGAPPYNGEGRFEIGDDGLPVVQAEETVPLTITLPRTPMPEAGFPLVVYFHGTAGASDQVVDRGPVLVPGGERTPGEGPAHVLARHGFATFGAALHLNPERYRGPVGAADRSYLNLNNLGAYPDTFRQMAIEQRLLMDAMAELEIDPEIVEACDLAPPPAGQAGFALDTRRVFVLGQSLGGQLVNMVGALDPRVAAAVPTGSGGYWSLTTLTAEFSPGIAAGPLVALLLGLESIHDHLHPALQLVQSVFEPAEPLVYAARLARDPLPGHPARSIYQPVGLDDPGFPNPIYAAMALASGTEQAGDALHPSLQRSLALEGLNGILAYPVSGNGRSRDGHAYTGAAVQYEDDGILDAHHIFAQLDDVKYQYGCFLRSLLAGGPGVVPAPRPIDSPCPE
jgi:dienelactone hydrolase